MSQKQQHLSSESGLGPELVACIAFPAELRHIVGTSYAKVSQGEVSAGRSDIRGQS